MVAGGDSISDLDLLRHGGMGRLFTGARAPSTLGAFLRAFRFGGAVALIDLTAAEGWVRRQVRGQRQRASSVKATRSRSWAGTSVASSWWPRGRF
jgi:hypothetical protein